MVQIYWFPCFIMLKLLRSIREGGSGGEAPSPQRFTLFQMATPVLATTRRVRLGDLVGAGKEEETLQQVKRPSSCLSPAHSTVSLLSLSQLSSTHWSPYS